VLCKSANINTVFEIKKLFRKKACATGFFFGSERDSSGTTEGRETPEGDGANSPTAAAKRLAARPNSCQYVKIILKKS
jgi:hypothetical protein